MSWIAKPKEINPVSNLFACEYGKHTAKRNIIRGRYEIANNLYQKDLFSHYGCVNAIEFSNDGQLLVSGGDDRRVLLWNVEKTISSVGKPQIMKGEHNSNIFCLGFNSDNTRLFSAGNDEQVIVHDSTTGETSDVILHEEAIYGLSVDPSNDNVFATACDDGRIFICDIRDPNLREPLTLIRSQSAFHAVMHSPVEPRFIATANSKEGIGLWDVRKPKTCLIQYNGGVMSSQSAMSVRFNCRGTQLLSLRRRMPPILYNVTSPHPIAEFDHAGYYNSCTMKSCSFAGDEDQFILSGSDDFKLYMWKIPEELFNQELSSPEIKWIDKAQLVLRGHRSIVNQVRFNYSNSIIASSGVEKIIKLWSVFPLPFGTGGIGDIFGHKDHRKVYSHEDYINLVLESGQFMSHDYSHQSVQEDPRMMAFFDSLVQRDIEGWTSDSTEESGSDTHSGVFGYFCATGRVSSNTDDSSLDSLSDADEAINFINPFTASYISCLNSRIEATATANANANGSTNEIEEGDEASTSSPKIESGARRICNDIDKITQLINEKKKDQLRKVARITLRTAKRRLKKVQKHCAKLQTTNDAANAVVKPSTSKHNSLQNENSIQSQLDNIQTVLDSLSKKVGVDASSFENTKNRRNSQKLRRRLRYLTDQSDFILNEVLPDRDSDSDSDSSGLLNSDDFLDVVTSGVERMRRMLPNADTDDSDSSSDASGSLENVDHLQVSSCSDDDFASSDRGGSERSRSRQESHTSVVPIAVSAEEEQEVNLCSNEQTKESNGGNNRCNNCDSQLVVQLPYLHNQCHSHSSTNCNDCECDRDEASVSFNKVNHLKRCYRKRKLEDTNDDNGKNKKN